MKKIFQNDVTIVLGGEAGQGIQSIDVLLGKMVKHSGLHYFSVSEFMSRVRGGSNSTTVRISSRPIWGFKSDIDILFPLHAQTLSHLQNRICEQTIVVGENEKIHHPGMIDVAFQKIAQDIGSALYANTLVTGYISGFLRLDVMACSTVIESHFQKKGVLIQEKNLQAFRKGYESGKNETSFEIVMLPDETAKTNLLLSGADTIALGALSGGCNYVCGYPMSPSTSVLENMAALSKKFGIIVEQVEDEVGVVNMGIGAWYAGARALVNTSGGGFALMCEGLSLAGMTESPLVVHIAQRPGPATGLPTRTEQSDLQLVVYAGHGDFPRIVLAPGTFEQGFELTRRAFDLADRYQVPVFILTDQFYVDSNTDVPVFENAGAETESAIIQTETNYKRFSYSKSGISPRGIPGYGEGLVCVDSDEHDESGHITEDASVRVKMMDKRMNKESLLQDACIPPNFYGSDQYTVLVVCWGSTLGTVREAVESLQRKDIGVVHFPWVFPLPDGTLELLKRAETVIALENNARGQFTDLVRVTTGFDIKSKILKYDGFPFSVEEVAAGITKLSRGIA